AVKHKIAPTTLATTPRTEGCANPQSVFRQAIASQTRTLAREEQAEEKLPRTSPWVVRGGKIPRSKGPALRRPRAAVAARRTALEGAASGRERYTMPPYERLPIHWSRWHGIGSRAAEPTRAGQSFTATER